MSNETPSEPDKLPLKPAPTPLDGILPVVYEELRLLARKAMRQEGAGHTLGATAVVNEAYLRLRDQRNLDVGNRAQFFALAATMIRRVLVDYARAKLADKRGGDRDRVNLSGINLGQGNGAEGILDLIALDDALTRLSALSERSARIVELRFFAGLTVDEVATAMQIGARTIADDWTFARAWLRRELGGDAKKRPSEKQ